MRQAVPHDREKFTQQLLAESGAPGVRWLVPDGVLVSTLPVVSRDFEPPPRLAGFRGADYSPTCCRGKGPEHML
jgi:hypothetical protein